MKFAKIEKIVSRGFDVAVGSGLVTGVVGVARDNLAVVYAALIGTFLTALAGSHYNDTREQREKKYVL